MKKVLHLIKGLGRGGAETLLAGNLRHADRARFEYQFAYCLPWKNALVEPLQAMGASVTCFPASNSLSLPRVAARLAAYCHKEGVDLLHCHLPVTGMLGRVAGKMAGVPVVYSEHNRQERYHPLTRWVNRRTWKYQEAVIAVSADVKRSIDARIGNAIPVHVVVNGVDTDLFVRDHESGRMVRRCLAIPPDAPVIGTVAVFRSQKRLDRWLEVAKMIHDMHDDVHFILVGDGPLMDAVKARAQRSEFSRVIHLPGLQPDVRSWLSAMDVFMMTSEVEGLPVALLEAMSMECAVAAIAAGGIAEVVEDGQSGVLVAQGDVAGLAGRVDRLLDRPAELCQLGRSARKLVVEQFGLRRMTREIEAVYESVLEGHRAS